MENVKVKALRILKSDITNSNKCKHKSIDTYTKWLASLNVEELNQVIEVYSVFVYSTSKTVICSTSKKERKEAKYTKKYAKVYLELVKEFLGIRQSLDKSIEDITIKRETINLNSKIIFELTDKGWQYLERYIHKIPANTTGLLESFKTNDGKCIMQITEVIKAFGILELMEIRSLNVELSNII